MASTIQTLLLLLAVMVVVAVVARRVNVAPTILLVIAGIGLALTPGLPRIELAPELVLLVILPPLIYSAGVAMSWREFRFNLRPITLLALGCVVFTTCAVAVMSHWLLGMPLAVAFVLGAIVAPPDAVAPLAMVRQLGIPRRIIVVLDGEGVANDATALAVCGKTPRQRKRLLIHFSPTNQRRGRCVGDLWIRAGCFHTSRRKHEFRRTIRCGRFARLCAMCSPSSTAAFRGFTRAKVGIRSHRSNF